MPTVVTFILDAPVCKVVDLHLHFGSFDAVKGGSVHPIAYGSDVLD